MRPPAHVVAAFRGSGEPVSIPGGRGGSWRVGGVVLKRSASTDPDLAEAGLAWQASHLPETPVRLARPVASTAGRYVVDGWTATAFLPGEHRPTRWLDVIAAGDALHEAFAGVSRPPMLDERTDPWAIADRVAWGERAAGAPVPTPLTRRLEGLLEPVPVARQLVHGDLTGNVLFADGLPPAVLDLSLYWRPRDYATAIVLVDALTWEGATPAQLAPVLQRSSLHQLMLRALLFRHIAAQLLDRAATARDEGRYDLALDLALALR